MGRMEPQQSAGRGNGLTPESVAFAAILALFVLSVFHTPVEWNWLFDTAYLLVAGYMAVRSRGARGTASGAEALPLTVALYLLLDSLLQTLVALCFPSWRILLFAGLTLVYLRTARRELQQRGILPGDLVPARLLQTPALFLTLCLAVPLACLYLPMLVIDNSWSAWSGPMVVYLPGTVHMSAGHAVHFGGLMAILGVEAAFSRLVALALAAGLCVHLARLSGYLPAARAQRLLQAAAVLTAVWWLLPARGIQSLRQPADLLFAVALALLLVQVFRPAAAATAQPVREPHL